MGLGTREILIALGILLVIAILLDGIRRVRNARHGDLRMGRRKQPVFDDDETCNGELPGNVRVVGVRDDIEAEQVRAALSAASGHNKFNLTVSREPQQVSLDLPLVAQRDEAGGSGLAAVASPAPTRKSRRAAQPDAETARVRTPRKAKEKAPAAGELAVVVIHVMAPPGGDLAGELLLKALLSLGMRYGDRKIFHRHSSEDGSGPVLFSMANSVKPGHFDLDAMSEFATPGVTFLMILAETEEPLAAFNLMIEAADSLARELGGELKDETRSVLTKQTIEHYRQRIQDYSRRQISEYH